MTRKLLKAALSLTVAFTALMVFAAVASAEPDDTTTSVEGTKVWNDGGYYGIAGYERPSVTISLNGYVQGKSDPVYGDFVIVTPDDVDSIDPNVWNWRFDDLPAYHDGQPISYSVTENAPEGFMTPDIQGTVVINTPLDKEDDTTLTPISITVLNIDGRTGTGAGLPGVMYKLEKKNESGNWDVVADDICTGAQGTALVQFDTEGEYRLTETTAPTGYDSPSWSSIITVTREVDRMDFNTEDQLWQWHYRLVPKSSDMVNGTITVVNSPLTSEFEGFKIWNDADYYGIPGYERPNVTLHLYSQIEGETAPTYERSTTIDEECIAFGTTNTWGWLFSDLPTYRDGKPVAYTVVEEPLTGFADPIIVNPSYDAPDGGRVTNTPLGKEDVLLPTSIVVTKVDALTNTGTGLVGATFKLERSSGDGTYTLVRDDLVTGADGTVEVEFTKDGEYLLTETGAPTGYVLDDPAWSTSITVERNFVRMDFSTTAQLWQCKYNLEAFANELDNGKLVVANNRQFIDIPVNAVWSDADDEDSIRPASVEVQLYQKIGAGEETAVEGALLTLSEDNNWKDAFHKLPMSIDGQKVTYSVKEVTTSVITGTDGEGAYSIEVTGSADAGFTITNTHTPDQGDNSGADSDTANNSPATGDSTHLILWLSIALSSLIVALFSGRKAAQSKRMR